MGRALPRIALALLLGAAIAWAVGNRGRFDAAALEAVLQGLGMWAPLAFVSLYAAAAVLFLPGAVMSLAGGALFGPLWGTVWNLAGATLGATLAFLAARYLVSDWVARKAGGRVRRLVDGVEGEGWRFVAFVRLVPLFPYNLLNYALGLTRIPLSHYVLATLFCMLPATIAYTYVGYAGREAVAGDESAIEKGLLGLGLLAALIFLPRLVRRIREADWIEAKELKRRLDMGEDVTVIDVRGADEFVGPLGHIPGARNLPFPDLPDRLAEIEGAREGKVALVCLTDKRSRKAARLLKDAGFRDARVLRRGMERWNREGFAVEGRGVKC